MSDAPIIDLRDRAPGHSLIEKLISEWRRGRIRYDAGSDTAEIDEQSVSWYLGVLGERATADRTRALPELTTVLHSVPVKSSTSDIDHVVLDSSGVTLVNSKYHAGAKIWSKGYGIYVGSHPEPHYVSNLIDTAHWVDDRLRERLGFSVPVRGVLCFVDPGRVDRGAPAGGGAYEIPIEVVTDAELVHTVLGRRRELSDEQLARLVAIGTRPETWHTSPRASDRGAHIAKEFDALHAELGAAIEDGIRRRAEERALRYGTATRQRAATRQPTAAGTRSASPPRSLPPQAPVGAPETPAANAPSPTAASPVFARTTGASLLALWPFAPALLLVVGTVAARGGISTAAVLGLSALWIATLIAPILLAALDTRSLRHRGIDLGGESVALALLGPLPHLIIRAARIGRRGTGAWGTLGVHALSGVGAAVLATVGITLAAIQ